MNNSIVLMGFMGCGKTTVGKALSFHLHIPYIDLDDFIELREGSSIPEIFQKKGEAYFRKVETSLLKVVLENDVSNVVALGGGTPLKKENQKLLAHANAMVIYLKATPKTLWERLRNDNSRPLLLKAKGEEERKQLIETMLTEREPVYEACATAILAVDQQDPEQIVQRIQELISSAKR